MSLEIYKKGQGKHTRLWSAMALVVIVGLGCYQLYLKLDAHVDNLWVQILVPAGIFAVLSMLVYWLVNKPTMADFMIAAEGEMKKVSWSSREEITVSTSIVIIVVVFMSALLGLSDLLLQAFFSWIIG
ncbi:MAG: preprotein translocase subunit SecE [Bacteroidales bacterium]|nr:preprotein translocase subunit SecE [Bacteroidales bacterium]